MAHTLMATTTGSDFEIAPPGPTAATCIDVVDLGLVTSQFYGTTVHKIEVYWVTTHAREDLSAPLTVRKRYTLSLHEKASLAKDLKSWRGKPFSDEEAKGFDVEKLIGATCLINIVHNKTGDKTYANVDSVMPLPKGMEAPEIPADYVRHISRVPSRDYRSDNYVSPDGNGPGARQQEAPVQEHIEQDDLPF
jgi:hypothetical protein